MGSLVSATRAVEQGKYDTELAVTGDDEIGRLAKSFNVMIRELRLKEQIRETFGKYVDPQLVQDLIDRPELTGSAGDRRIMTIYFCDMKGFSALAEDVTPASLVKVLNRYFTIMSEEIRSRHGVVDKYIGDAVMAYWGPPFAAADQQGKLACEAGLAQLRRFTASRTKFPRSSATSASCPSRMAAAHRPRTCCARPRPMCATIWPISAGWRRRGISSPATG